MSESPSCLEAKALRASIEAVKTKNSQHILCDWCGKPAITVAYRTLYTDTEYEQTSRYYECKKCSQLATTAVVKVKPLLKYRVQPRLRRWTKIGHLGHPVHRFVTTVSSDILPF